MKSALILNAVDPSIGGVLISGQKGTGKSTAVRGLARILPKIEVVEDCPYHCEPHDERMMCDDCKELVSKGEITSGATHTMPIVDLPLSATEDRVVGTLHVEHALKSGTRKFEPGLMAAANRGILYVDEVNLLDDHLVDILLDAAAAGINIVEREGISHVHPTRFMLVGTMNPEEGDLRPQFLDRFGLCVAVKGLSDKAMRMAIARQRIEFDQDPKTFTEKWIETESVLSQQIIQARASLKDITVPDAMLALAVQLSLDAAAQGHRSDIVIIKTAGALAALLEKKEVTADHIAEAARFVLPHRINSVGMATVDAVREKLENTLAKVMGSQSGEDDKKSEPIYREDLDDISTQVPGHVAASNMDLLASFLAEKKKHFSMPMS